jgi:predicted O-methyltransferase YrrM
MIRTYRSEDWNTYRMMYNDPHRTLEPLESEVAIVNAALNVLNDFRVLPHTRYDHAKMMAHRQAVRKLFDIPWTAITPRMQRLLYAINAIVQPKNMIAAGVFCGNTFISNAGAAVGPGACYTAKHLIGVEVKPEEAERAERNVRRIDSTGVACVVPEDAIQTISHFSEQIDLLYIDADDERKGKGIYLDILEAAYEKMPHGGVVLAHNSVTFWDNVSQQPRESAEQLKLYLEFVRNPAYFHASVNVIFDIDGLEVSIK